MPDVGRVSLAGGPQDTQPCPLAQQGDDSQLCIPEIPSVLPPFLTPEHPRKL